MDCRVKPGNDGAAFATSDRHRKIRKKKAAIATASFFLSLVRY
jgi:hypothetical protein